MAAPHFVLTASVQPCPAPEIPHSHRAPGAWEDAGCWHEPRCHRCDKQRWWSDAALAQQSPENIFMNFHPLNASLKTAFHQLPSRNNELKMSSAAAAQPGELCLILLPSPPDASASPWLHIRRGDAIPARPGMLLGSVGYKCA